jgi:hypothetical protein
MRASVTNRAARFKALRRQVKVKRSKQILVAPLVSDAYVRYLKEAEEDKPPPYGSPGQECAGYLL